MDGRDNCVFGRARWDDSGLGGAKLLHLCLGGCILMAPLEELLDMLWVGEKLLVLL